MLKVADAQLCPICGGMVHLTMDRDFFDTCKNTATCITLECSTCNLKMTEFSGITGFPSLDYESTLNALITRWNSLPQPAPMVAAITAPTKYKIDENTTWRDLARRYEPERLGEDWGCGVCGCPAHLELAPEGAPLVGRESCLDPKGCDAERGCRACWDSKVQAPPVEVNHDGSLTKSHRMNTIIHQIATTKECSIETAQELDRLLHKEKLLPMQLYLRMNLLGGCMQVLTVPDVQMYQVTFPFQRTLNFGCINDIPEFLLQLYDIVAEYAEFISKAGSVLYKPDKDEVIK